MHKLYFIPTLLLFLLGCKPSQNTNTRQAQPGQLIFHSGFEGNSKVISRGSDADIIGLDNTLTGNNHWTNLDNHPDIGNFNIQFQGGDSTMRYVKIIPEPGNPKNKILQFWLNEPNVEASKGRIQANLYGNKSGLKEIYQSVRVFLPTDFNTVKTFPKTIHWLTIAEFWNNVTWLQTQPYGFRITLGIGKIETGPSDLHFILDAEDCQLFIDGKQKYTTIWKETNKHIAVPIGKWFTMDYYYQEGNHETGRFYLAITPEGEKKHIIFDVKNFTHNTKDPNPDGVTDFNPLKLYTSKELINHMRSQGKTLQIYWDDFKLWKNKRPE